MSAVTGVCVPLRLRALFKSAFLLFRDVSACRMGKAASLTSFPEPSVDKLKQMEGVLSIPGEVSRERSIKPPYSWEYECNQDIGSG